MPPRISDLLTFLPERHRRALRWFEDHAGSEVPWPEPLADGTLLVTKAKGIYKPEWSDYALSVRQTLGGPYPDREIATRDDGTWQYHYFQENLELAGRDRAFTNQGLLACNRDTVPVGVMLQTHGKPRVRYRIVGLAFVNGWESGYFVLDGVRPAEALVVRDAARILTLGGGTLADAIARPFEAPAHGDERQRVLKEIRVRQGQTGFRNQILEAYGRACAISQYDAPEALDAAHIIPYRGPVTHHPQNGILLRVDLHSLFDLGLMAIHEESLRVVLSPELMGTKYARYASAPIMVPELESLRPSRIALGLHRMESGL